MSDVSVTNGTGPAATPKAPRKARAAAPKKAAAKAAKKVPAKKVATNPDFSKAVAKSWKDPKVAKARSARHGVRVAGKDYSSTYAAFVALKLPLGSHIGFRGKLKKAGKLDFETDTGRKVSFAIIKA